MLKTTIALALLALPASALPTSAPSPSAPAAVVGDHGKLPWYEGTWEEALAEAKRADKVVFIDFWTDWCGWCKRLDKEAFSDDGVVQRMQDVVCVSIDAESDKGSELAKYFGVRGYPTLVWLSPDGTVRDRIGGYLPIDAFGDEVARIKKGEDTIPALKASVAANPKDLQARYELLQKVRDWNDAEAVKGMADAQLAAIREIDPEGKSPVSRRLALEEELAGLQKTRTPDTKRLRELLAAETDQQMLFQGWYAVRAIHRQLAGAGEEAQQAEHRAIAQQAARKVWASVPEQYVSGYGNQLAWELYEDREHLDAEGKAFALEVARKAAKAAGDDPNVLDTLACCLQMNGKTDEAIAKVRRCIELDPNNQDWRQRLKELGAEG